MRSHFAGTSKKPPQIPRPARDVLGGGFYFHIDYHMFHFRNRRHIINTKKLEIGKYLRILTNKKRSTHERVLISKKYDMSEEIPQANPSVSNETAPVAPAPVAAAPVAPAAPVSAPKPVAPAVELPKAKFAAAAKPVSVAAPKNVVNVEEKPSILAIAVDVVAAAVAVAFAVLIILDI